MISTSSKVILIDASLGTEVLCFKNRLEAVRALMENAGIAPVSEYYGSPSHEEAVKNIRAHCDVVLEAIYKDRAEDEAIERGDREPEQA